MNHTPENRLLLVKCIEKVAKSCYHEMEMLL